MEKSLTPEYNSKELYPHFKMLSSSQFLMYEKDPKDFYIRYQLGADDKHSIAMQVGSIFSELHRDRAFDHKAALASIKAPRRLAGLFESAIKAMPVIPAEVKLVCKLGKWKFRATLDGYVQDSYTIVENKTGKLGWNQERVDFSDQLTFQAWVHWKKFGVIPKSIILNWVNTNSSSSCLVRTFKTTRSVKCLKMFERRVEAVISSLEAGNFTNKIYAGT